MDYICTHGFAAVRVYHNSRLNKLCRDITSVRATLNGPTTVNTAETLVKLKSDNYTAMQAEMINLNIN